MTVAVAAVGVLVAALHVLDGAALGHGRVEPGDVVFEERGDRLAHELRGHLEAAGPVVFLGAAMVVRVVVGVRVFLLVVVFLLVLLLCQSAAAPFIV